MLSNETFWIKQDDESFFQPNFYLMPRMINFICKNLSIKYQSSNLLELYCGCGTFTLPLSRYFNYVFATENNRKAISHLHSSIKKNNFKNINIAIILHSVANDPCSDLAPTLTWETSCFQTEYLLRLLIKKYGIFHNGYSNFCCISI